MTAQLQPNPNPSLYLRDPQTSDSGWRIVGQSTALIYEINAYF